MRNTFGLITAWFLLVSVPVFAQEHNQPLMDDSSMSYYQLENQSLIPVNGNEVLAANAVSQADLNDDGRDECLILQDERAILLSYPCSENSNPAWESPEGWKVTQAELADLNQDGRLEITLLVWRDFQPWPVERFYNHTSRIAANQNADGQSCHLILIGRMGERYREVWAGSALVDPLQAFAPADLDGDGLQELAVLESHYSDAVNTPAWALSAWEWNGFGFSLIARHEGAISALQTSQRINGVQILMVEE